MAQLALVTVGCSCFCRGVPRGTHVHRGCAGQPEPQTGFISADMESTELQALPFGSFLISVVRGQGFHGNWRADKCDPPREGLRALAAQTSQPLPLVPVSLRAEAVMCTKTIAVGKAHLNSLTLSPGCVHPLPFTQSPAHTVSHTLHVQEACLREGFKLAP